MQACLKTPEGFQNEVLRKQTKVRRPSSCSSSHRVCRPRASREATAGGAQGQGSVPWENSNQKIPTSAPDANPHPAAFRAHSYGNTQATAMQLVVEATAAVAAVAVTEPVAVEGSTQPCHS